MLMQDTKYTFIIKVMNSSLRKQKYVRNNKVRASIMNDCKYL